MWLGVLHNLLNEWSKQIQHKQLKAFYIYFFQDKKVEVHQMQGKTIMQVSTQFVKRYNGADVILSI